MPQGRCHYFINLTLAPMAMIWVYAGDKPDRIVMDETFCHPERVKGEPGLAIVVPQTNDRPYGQDRFTRRLADMDGIRYNKVDQSR